MLCGLLACLRRMTSFLVLKLCRDIVLGFFTDELPLRTGRPAAYQPSMVMVFFTTVAVMPCGTLRMTGVREPT